MKRIGLRAGLLLASALPLACGSTIASVEPTPPPPTTSTFEIVGIVEEEGYTRTGQSFKLENGRVVEFDRSAVRVLFDSGHAPRLFVSGTDAVGDWVAIFGKQDGMPPDCNVINTTGRDWGSGIGIFGIIWPKSAAIAATSHTFGSVYPEGTRFCLDDDAHVAAVIGP